MRSLIQLATTSVLALSLIVPAISADAREGRGNKTRGVTKRAQHQRDRTRQGLKSGELTKDEAKEIRSDGRAIKQKRDEFRSDGKVTLEERKELHRDLNESSRNIYREKHDEEKRKELAPGKRIEIQRDRIKQGVKSGELTGREAKQEASDLRDINQDRKAMRNDGDGLTDAEREQLQNRLDAESEDIYQQKHDRQDRN